MFIHFSLFVHCNAVYVIQNFDRGAFTNLSFIHNRLSGTIVNHLVNSIMEQIKTGQSGVLIKKTKSIKMSYCFMTM